MALTYNGRPSPPVGRLVPAVPTSTSSRARRRPAPLAAWRRRRHVLGLLAAAFTVALLGTLMPGAAATTTPTPPPDQEGVSSSVASVPTLAIVLFDSDIVLVGGRGFLPGEDTLIEATTDSLGGSATMKPGEDGRFLLGFRVPAGFVGTVSVVATQGERVANGQLDVDTRTAVPTLPVGGEPGAGSPLDTVGEHSGLPWMSGVHPDNPLQPYLDFGTWRGRAIDVAHVFTIRDNGWGPLVEPKWPVDDFKAFPGTLVISQPLYPEGAGNNAECASGAYNEQWKKFGSFLVNRNRADSIVRLGWEFNGKFMYWHVDDDPTNWVKCFQNIATAIRSTNPDVKIDWTFNGHNSPVPAGGTPWPAYPGDEYVDYIGIDPYDHFPPSHSDEAFDKQCNDPNGLCYAAQFAREHGKKLSVGEWGVASCSGNGGGDNPLYIRKMWETFVANKDVMGYESYFSDPNVGNVCSTLHSGTGDGGQNPRSGAEYKRLWGAGV
ncbi:beta-mannanase [Frankia sp. CN4]|nr:beta-mannanase [Frankia nepalensis]